VVVGFVVVVFVLVWEFTIIVYILEANDLRPDLLIIPWLTCQLCLNWSAAVMIRYISFCSVQFSGMKKCCMKLMTIKKTLK